MEKLVLPYDVECMKMVMLQHEETFKQQVYELHRLYQIQRMMMKSIQRSKQNQETWSMKEDITSMNNQKIQNNYVLHNNPQKQDPVDENSNPVIINESEIELTLGPISYSTRKKIKSTELNSDSMASYSYSSTDSSHKSRVTIENSRVLRVEDQPKQVHTSFNEPPWLCRV